MKKLLFSSLLVASLASFAFGGAYGFPGNGGIVIKPANGNNTNTSSTLNYSNHQDIYINAFCKYLTGRVCY